ncbi:hypothetical protein [Paenibacillus xylanexedens]|nr:hypothetical protein [Paenibacillus xylanexedens]
MNKLLELADSLDKAPSQEAMPEEERLVVISYTLAKEISKKLREIAEAEE